VRSRRLRGLLLCLLPALVATSCLRGQAYEGAPVLGQVPALLTVDADALQRGGPPGQAGTGAELPANGGSEATRDGGGQGAEPGEVGAGRGSGAPDDGGQGDPARPAWLGTIPLPPAPAEGGFLPTPPELDDRRLPPPPSPLPRPSSAAYTATVSTIPPDVLARSTWHPDCPVGLEELRYVTVTHWGFDGRLHTGELIVHEWAARQMTRVFERLHAARFPIEELRVISQDDLHALSTGDGNVSSAFVCRRTVSGRRWSEHAYGTAIDLNPFHNPYARGRFVVPGLAASYLDRARHRPGMIHPDDEVVRAFADIGWRWGGDWGASKDWMHFSANGR
jgi:hypothetical protein